MRLIQFEDLNGNRRVAAVGRDDVRPVNGALSTRELTLEAIAKRDTLAATVDRHGVGEAIDYRRLLTDGRVLPPLDHPDPAHCLVSGTGLTHLGSAAARDAMHQKVQAAESALTDSMRIFKWGIEGGKPPEGIIGAQPEWFYKGDGSIVVRPGGDFPLPSFALDGGDEAEIVGLYIIAPDGTPWRLGYALGNEYSDHVMERQNYLYLAHSKLRGCSFGPELLVGTLPRHLEGESRIRRAGKVVWEKPFLSGEDNMCHFIANLEHHHFKYAPFRRPGDVHVHFFGAAVLSCADGIETAPGDEFEVASSLFGEPLRNRLAERSKEPDLPVRTL